MQVSDLALARVYDATGHDFPVDAAFIADKTKLSRRYASAVLATLVEKGVLKREGRDARWLYSRVKPSDAEPTVYECYLIDLIHGAGEPDVIMGLEETSEVWGKAVEANDGSEGAQTKVWVGYARMFIAQARAATSQQEADELAEGLAETIMMVADQ
ncbi:hypothetical protein ACLBV5_09575 [Brevundimonas sp. M1A4_2e]